MGRQALRPIIEKDETPRSFIELTHPSGKEFPMYKHSPPRRKAEFDKWQQGMAWDRLNLNWLCNWLIKFLNNLTELGENSVCLAPKHGNLKSDWSHTGLQVTTCVDTGVQLLRVFFMPLSFHWERSHAPTGSSLKVKKLVGRRCGEPDTGWRNSEATAHPMYYQMPKEIQTCPHYRVRARRSQSHECTRIMWNISSFC